MNKGKFNTIASKTDRSSTQELNRDPLELKMQTKSNDPNRLLQNIQSNTNE